MDSESLKCVVVGDGSVGKTCLLIRYAKDEYPTDYIPTVFDSYTVSLPIGGESYELCLFDTAGQEDFDQLRKLAFFNTDVLLVCFAVDYWPSFINVREMWIPELQKYCSGVPYLLVGTRIDLRNDQKTIDKLATIGKSPISKAQGEKLARELQAIKYVECSALTTENVNDVFQEAVLSALSDNNSPPPMVTVHSTSASNSSSNVSSNNNTNTNNRNNNAPAQQTNGTEDGAWLSCCPCCGSCTLL